MAKAKKVDRDEQAIGLGEPHGYPEGTPRDVIFREWFKPHSLNHIASALTESGRVVLAHLISELFKSPIRPGGAELVGEISEAAFAKRWVSETDELYEEPLDAPGSGFPTVAYEVLDRFRSRHLYISPQLFDRIIEQKADLFDKCEIKKYKSGNIATLLNNLILPRYEETTDELDDQKRGPGRRRETALVDPSKSPQAEVNRRIKKLQVRVKPEITERMERARLRTGLSEADFMRVSFLVAAEMAGEDIPEEYQELVAKLREQMVLSM